jgi:acyl-coenzyme A thioesterase PaaI-like protein
VTARLSVDFTRIVPIDRAIRAEGRVTRVRRRLVDAEGVVIEPETGEVLARAEATYVGAPESRKQELKERYAFRLEPETGQPGMADAR